MTDQTGTPSTPNGQPEAPTPDDHGSESPDTKDKDKGKDKDKEDSKDTAAPFGALSWQIAGFAVMALAYWAFILSLPDNAEPLAISIRVCIAIAAGLSLALGVGTLIWGATKGPPAVGIAVAFIVLAIALVVVAILTDRPLRLEASTRFALGVGGLALLSLVIGVQQFKTVRAAGSAALVVIFIGLATWPNAEELIDSAVQEKVITWTGIVLGVAVLAEAGKQAAHSAATAKTAAAAVNALAAGGGVAPAGKPGGFVVEPAANRQTVDAQTLFKQLESFSLQEPPGDLR